MKIDEKTHADNIVLAGEAMARFVILLVSALSFVVIAFALVVLPPSEARNVLLIYHSIIAGAVVFVPLIPQLKNWDFRRHLYWSAYHYIGFHAYYLYVALGTKSEISRVYPMTIMYGLILVALLAQSVQMRSIVAAAGIYFLFVFLATITQFDATILAWLVTLLGGEVFVCYYKYKAEQVNNSLIEAIQSRDQEMANLRLATAMEATQHFAHDVRKPFALMDMFLKAVRDESNADQIASVVRYYWDALNAASARATGYISDLLTLDSHSLLQVSEVSLGHLIKNSLELVFYGKGSKDIRFEYGPGLGSIINVNDYKFTRVLVNLIDNAQQAMAGAGTIAFSAVAVGVDQIQISVRNTNSAVSKEDFERLFEPFFTKGKSGGTGLGLAVCKKIVGAHGGQITCNSDASGQGYTEFLIVIPGEVITASPHDPLPMRFNAVLKREEHSGDFALAGACTVKIGRNRPVVWVIDDDPFVLDHWQNTMIDADVLVFDSADDFWRSYEDAASRSELISGVIVDYYLNEGNESDTGFVVASDLKARGFEGRIVLSTHRMFDNSPNQLFDCIIDKTPRLWSDLLKS